MTTDSPPAIQPVLRPDFLPVTPQSEAAGRAAVVAEARSWMHTRYVKLAARKGVGVDCAMLLVRCWIEAGIFEEFDPRPYPPDWHLHRSEERYLGWMMALGTETTDPQPGDVVVFLFGRCYSHAGIVSKPGYLIHSFARLGSVQESEFRDGYLVGRKPRYFNLWDKHKWQA